MPKKDSIISKTKYKICFYLKSKWWWINQINDVIGALGILLYVLNVPKAIPTIIAVIWVIVFIISTYMIKKEKKAKGFFNLQ